LGKDAGKNSASSGVFVGAAAGFSATTATNSTFVGEWAGVSNTTGAANTAVGAQTLSFTTTGSNNTAVGSQAAANTNASERTIIGASAGANGVAGGNTLVGYGVNLAQELTGTDNTIVGKSAGGLGSGSNNLILGNGASASTSSVSNQITLGNSSITALRCQVTTISALSDMRDKTNVQDSTYGLELVNQLRPVTFDWNMRDGAKVGVPDLGFIAQELAAVEDNYDPERLALTLRDNPDKLEATPGRLIPILVKAIQELSAEIEELKNAR
jgi:hypothetical protein